MDSALITALGAHLDQDEANARALVDDENVSVGFFGKLAVREVGRKRTLLTAASEAIERGEPLPSDLEFEIHQMAIGHGIGEPVDG